MFEWLGYKKRLVNVRAELEALATPLEETAPEVKRAVPERLELVASSAARICRILIRVIDSLP